MKYLVSAFLILFISIGFSSCNSNPFREDMVNFDRLFIPAYYYTYIGQEVNARKAMLPLDYHWRKMEEKYLGMKADSEDWQESFRLTRVWLEEASRMLDEGETSSALCQLDHARYEWIDLRWRYKMDYYLDSYWDLEGAMSIVIETAQDPMLDLIDWKEFMELTRELRTEWDRLKDRPLKAEDHQLSDEEILLLLERYVVFEELLLHFEWAVESADLCEVKESGKAVEMAYFNCLALFGDFAASEVYYANNN